MSANQPQLIVALEGNVVQTVALSTATLTIGRTPDNGLSLPHPNVSRRHAELRLTPAGLALTDTGSSNGTFVNGQQLLPQQPRVLPNGATFDIGPFTITFHAGADAAASAADVLAEGEQPVVAPEPVAAPIVAPVRSATAPPPPAPPRPSDPPEPLRQRASSYLRRLPVIYEESDFLGRFLLLFETVWEPLEQRQDHIQMYVDPASAPAGFLPWLASWLDADLSPHWPEARRRQLLGEAMELHRWRGTRYGLARMLELHTGLTPEISDEPGQPFVFHVRLAVPAGAALERAVVEELIQTHKPAHAGYVLELVS
jgi:phage tail-like protein